MTPEQKMSLPDFKKIEIVKRVIEHLKTVSIEDAMATEGINASNYYSWKKLIKNEGQVLFEPVSKLEIPTSRLIEMLEERSDCCIIVVKEKSTISTKVKGEQKQYDFLSAVMGLQACEHFNIKIGR